MFRSESPPPRQPSPDFLPAPLPYPRHHPRRIQSQPKIRVHSPMLLPPGLPSKTLQSTRSCDYIRGQPPVPVLSADTSPSTSPTPSHSGKSSPSPSFTPHHRRTLSVAYPSPSSSRSASPIPLITIDSDPLPSVPLPPVVPYRYTGPQYIICPKPVSLAKQIILPDIDAIHSTPSSTVSVVTSKTPFDDSSVIHQEPDISAIPQLHSESYANTPVSAKTKARRRLQAQTVPPLEKHKSMGIACLKFFGLRPATTRQPRTAMAAM